MTLDYMQSAERTEFEHCLSNGDLKRCDDIVDLVEHRINHSARDHQIVFDTAHWALINELVGLEYQTLVLNNRMMPAESEEERIRIEHLAYILEQLGVNGSSAVRYGVQPCR